MKYSNEGILGYFKLILKTTTVISLFYLCPTTISTTSNHDNNDNHNNGNRHNPTTTVVVVSPKTMHITRATTESTTAENQMMMYTYVDFQEPYVDEELVKIWHESWKSAGWEVHALSHKDAKKHSMYEEYSKLLDDANVCCLPRQTYYRHLAMSTMQDGGYFSETFTFPLHKVSEEGSGWSSDKLPNQGKMTLHDGVLGSVMSGNETEWNRMTQILFMNTIKKNAMLAIRYIVVNTSSPRNPIFELETSNLIENFTKFNVHVCRRAQTKFFIRFHDHEIAHHGIDVKNRSSVVKNWMDFYVNLCWNTNNNTPLPVTRTTANLNARSPIILSEADRTVISNDEHLNRIIDDSTPSEITCDDVSCKVTNACVAKGGVLKLIGNDSQYQKLQERISRTMLHAWVCTGCNRLITPARHTSVGSIWSKTATLSVGIDISNCGHHLGDVLWPLIRLHSKFRDANDIIENGIGILFLQSPVTPCDALFHAVSEQVVRYQDVTEDNEMCFENVYLGTHKMNFMTASGVDATFLPYDNFNRDMRTMRSLFWNNYGFDVSNAPVADTIIITQKRKGYGKLRTLKYHNIANIPQIVNMIKNEFNNKYKIQIVSWEDYNIKQQVYLMSRTKFMISLPGSAIMNAFLLPDKSTLTCYCQVGEIINIKDDSSTIYNSKGVKFQKSNELLLWFDRFDYGHFYEFCDEPDTYISGVDTIVNVDVLKDRMLEFGL